MKAVNIVDQNRMETEDDSGSTGFVSNADVISLETMVNMMVNKGICTEEELFRMESLMQRQNQKNDSHFIPIQNYRHRGKFPALKRSMSKRRWSRQLGSLLFGWKWKKVKKNQSL